VHSENKRKRRLCDKCVNTVFLKFGNGDLIGRAFNLLRLITDASPQGRPGYTRMDRGEPDGPGWTKVDWGGLGWTGVDWGGPGGPEWTGVD